MAYQKTRAELSVKDTSKIMDVALGKEKADLAVIHASILNVYTGELCSHQGISIRDKWIAYVGPNAIDTVGPDTQVIDATGKTVIPGLIDGHTHLAWTGTPYEFLRYIMKGGTTTLITETLEPYPVAGLAGVLDFLRSDESMLLVFTSSARIDPISVERAYIRLSGQNQEYRSI